MCDKFIKDIRAVVSGMNHDNDQSSHFINIRNATAMSLTQWVVVYLCYSKSEGRWFFLYIFQRQLKYLMAENAENFFGQQPVTQISLQVLYNFQNYYINIYIYENIMQRDMKCLYIFSLCMNL